jgi:hypothetical protein
MDRQKTFEDFGVGRYRYYRKSGAGDLLTDKGEKSKHLIECACSIQSGLTNNM